LRESTIQEFLRTPPRRGSNANNSTNNNTNTSSNNPNNYNLNNNFFSRRRLDVSSNPGKEPQDIDISELKRISRSEMIENNNNNSSNNNNNSSGQSPKSPIPSYTRKNQRKLTPLSENVNRFTMLNGPDSLHPQPSNNISMIGKKIIIFFSSFNAFFRYL
jgi:hypothetical protein